MTHLRTLVFSLLSVGALAMPASAATFTLEHFSVDLRDSDPGRVVWADPIVTSRLSFTLDTLGSSTTGPVFTLGTNETASIWDDLSADPLGVDLGQALVLRAGPGLGGVVDRRNEVALGLLVVPGPQEHGVGELALGEARLVDVAGVALVGERVLVLRAGGLEAPQLSEEQMLGLLYDLGNAQEIGGEREAAYRTLVEIYGINSNYRDVVARLEDLGRR
jgi:hypothetical protein